MRLKKTDLAKKEILLVAHLRRDGRASLTELSSAIKMPISTLHDKLRMQTTIKKHTCLVDFSKMGFMAQAAILLKTRKEDKEHLKEFLRAHKNVNSILKVNAGFDFLVEGFFHNFVDLELFLELVEKNFSIKGKQVFYVVEEVGRELFFAELLHVKELMEEESVS